VHVKEIYVIFIHLFDSGILLIIDLNKKKREKKGGGIINFKKKKNVHGHRSPGFFNKKLILDYYFCLMSGPVFLFQIFIITPLPLPRDITFIYSFV
jgi:hypothetical protein